MGTLAPVPRICGREAEIQALGEALDRVAAGGPAIVLAEGEAGIGKTRLLAKALEDAAGRGMRVAAGRAEELERTRPFGVLAATLGCARSSPDPLRAAIAALLADPGAGWLPGPICSRALTSRSSPRRSSTSPSYRLDAGLWLPAAQAHGI